MIHLPKMELVFVSVLAIALLPSYAIAGFTSNPAPGWTQPGSQMIADLQPAPDSGTPEGSRTPGGTRGNCKQTNKSLTALVPENGKGLTTAEHPVFWFYIPNAAEDIHSIEFSLHPRSGDDESTTLYRTTLQLTKTPGIIGVPLPPSPEHSLKLNQIYHWLLIVNCDRQPTSENVLELNGWVTRVQPSPNQVIWYDELTNLAKRYLSNPQNPEVKKAWTELLKSVGLEGLAQAPLVGSVSNPKND